jgi:SAM-dependent methyltransferase
VVTVVTSSCFGLTEVIGVDHNRNVADAAVRSGIYSQVHVAAAHEVPEASGTFDYVFANCSLEHMERLEDVLAEIYRCLKPGGRLLCSVVTDRFVHWALLPQFVAMAGFAGAAEQLQQDFMAYHNLANPLPPEEWEQKFTAAGLLVEQHIPIVPMFSSGLFLMIDNLWHVKRRRGGEMGDTIMPFLSANPNFPQGFRDVIAGLLHMERDREDCSGAVFLAKKSG